MSRCTICHSKECYEEWHEKPCPNCGQKLLVFDTKAMSEVDVLRALLADAADVAESMWSSENNDEPPADLANKLSEWRAAAKAENQGDQ